MLENLMDYGTNSDYIIDNSEVAVNIAKAVWKDLYGKNVLRFQRVTVYLNEEKNIWVVAGESIFYLIRIPYIIITGGSPYMFIDRTTGEIIGVGYTR